MSTITDFLPPFAEAKDVSRAIEDPSLLNLGVAGLAALGPAGRFLKRGLKSTAKNVVVNKAEREAAAAMSESELQQIVVKKGPVGSEQELRKVYQGTPHKFAPEPGYPNQTFGENPIAKPGGKKDSFDVSPLSERAAKEFGVTNHEVDAGYILQDGRMLDFGDAPGGGKTRDHGEVSRLFDPGKLKAQSQSPQYRDASGRIIYDSISEQSAAKAAFIGETGALRVSYSPPLAGNRATLQIQSAQPLSDKQISQLSSRKFREVDYVYVDDSAGNGMAFEGPTALRDAIKYLKGRAAASQQGPPTPGVNL